MYFRLLSAQIKKSLILKNNDKIKYLNFQEKIQICLRLGTKHLLTLT